MSESEEDTEPSRAKRKKQKREISFMNYSVYILECADKTLYTGSTNNLEKRLKEHNESKRGAHYTKIRRPVKLLYSEEFATFNSARHREAEIKRWPREKKLALISGVI